MTQADFNEQVSRSLSAIAENFKVIKQQNTQHLERIKALENQVTQLKSQMNGGMEVSDDGLGESVVVIAEP